jgi:hypothetical protein
LTYGSLLEAQVRRFKGNDTTPVYTKELDYLKKTFQVRPFDLEKLYDEWDHLSTRHNIITNGGRDYLHTQGYITPAATAVFQYIGVTSDTVAPAAGDTTLTSEITTNGLIRAVATTDTHSGGTNTSTVGITFTATGTLTAVQKGALFTAVTVGIMANEATFSSTSLVNGDQLQLTWTITLG